MVFMTLLTDLQCFQSKNAIESQDLKLIMRKIEWFGMRKFCLSSSVEILKFT